MADEKKIDINLVAENQLMDIQKLEDGIKELAAKEAQLKGVIESSREELMRMEASTSFP